MKTTNVLAIRADKSTSNCIDQTGEKQFYSNPRLSIDDRYLSQIDYGYVRVNMLVAGICGTDVHAVQTSPETGCIIGTAPIDIPLTYGRVLGHEGVGQVIQKGDGVSNIQLGDYVTFESIITCKTCKPCRKGQFNQCNNAKLLGLQQDGLFGATVDVPAALAHNISDLMDSEYGLAAACCVEPAGCGYVAATASRVSPGDNVLIFGAGPIGTMTAMLCREVFGAAEIHVVEPNSYRRIFVSRWATHVYDIEAFSGATLSHSIDVIIEASGESENVNNAFRRLAPNGRVALLARSGKPLSIKHIDYMITNFISILGSRGHLCGAFNNILHMIRVGRLPLHETVTDTITGLVALKECLENPTEIFEKNCKVLVHLSYV